MTMSFTLLKRVVFALMFCSLSWQLQAQSDTSNALSDTSKQSMSTLKQTLNDLPFILDDIAIVGGMNRSGLFWSPESRNLNYGNGFQLGAELQIPTERFFFTGGLHYMQTGFSYSTEHTQQVKSKYIAAPLTLSFPLPEFSLVNWQVFTGIQAHLRASSSVSSVGNTGFDGVIFDPDHFTSFDAGLILGTSAEYRNFLFRARTVIGTARYSTQIQGSLNTLHFEVGYFLFRPFRNRFSE